VPQTGSARPAHRTEAPNQLALKNNLHGRRASQLLRKLGWAPRRPEITPPLTGGTPMSARDDESGFYNNRFSVKFINGNIDFTVSTLVGPHFVILAF
jgi:hypothetical protein